MNLTAPKLPPIHAGIASAVALGTFLVGSTIYPVFGFGGMARQLEITAKIVEAHGSTLQLLANQQASQTASFEAMNMRMTEVIAQLRASEERTNRQEVELRSAVEAMRNTVLDFARGAALVGPRGR